MISRKNLLRFNKEITEQFLKFRPCRKIKSTAFHIISSIPVHDWFHAFIENHVNRWTNKTKTPRKKNAWKALWGTHPKKKTENFWIHFVDVYGFHMTLYFQANLLVNKARSVKMIQVIYHQFSYKTEIIYSPILFSVWKRLLA